MNALDCDSIKDEGKKKRRWSEKEEVGAK